MNALPTPATVDVDPEPYSKPRVLDDLEGCILECFALLEEARAAGNGEVAKFAEDRLNLALEAHQAATIMLRRLRGRD